MCVKLSSGDLTLSLTPHTLQELRVCLVDYNRHCNVIVILMIYLFYSLVMILLQRKVIL